EDGDAPPRVHVGCAQVAASVEGTVEDVGKVLVRPNDVGEGLAGSHSDNFAGSNRDSDPSLIADDSAEQDRIGQLQAARRRRRAELYPAWHHQDQVGAETLDL